MNRFLQAVLVYEKRGWCVIPCKPGTKVPAVDWKKYQENKSTKNQLENWWADNPDYNVAIVTGEISGITLIDIDGSKGIESLTTLPEPLPDTRRHYTPHGTHHLYQYQSLLYTGANFLPGIDVRNDGGIAVMPPSVVDGEEYKVEANSDVFSRFDLPPDVLYQRKHEIIPLEDQYIESNNWITEAMKEGCSEGDRNTTAIRLAGYFKSKGMHSDITDTLLSIYGERCDPPMDLVEIHTVVGSAERYRNIVQNESLTGLTYHWPEAGITVKVDNPLRTSSSCKCVVTVEDMDGCIFAPASIDFLSVSSRSGLIRTLVDQRPLDWRNIVETVTWNVLDYLSGNDSVVSLNDYIDSDIPKWLLEPFILGDGATILFGQGGLGKSLLALAAMITLDTGHKILGSSKSTLMCRGMYLDWEDSAETQGERYNMLMRGIGKTPNHDYEPLHRRCNSPLQEILPRIHSEIERHGINYLVIDSAALACGGAPDNSDSALSFFNALNRLKLPGLVIAHQTKDVNKPYPFGSIFWHNSARCTWEIKSKNSPGENSIPIILVNQKSNRGSKHSRIGYEVHFDEPNKSIRILSRNSSEVSATFGAEGASIKEQVYSILKESPQTIKSLAIAMGETENSIRVMIKRDQDSKNGGYFVRTGKAGDIDLWALQTRHVT